jgi:hypothetical protein
MISGLFAHKISPSEIDAMDWFDLKYWYALWDHQQKPIRDALKKNKR